MADYIYIDNLANKGKIGISRLCFETLVSNTIASLPDVGLSAKTLKKNQKFRLNRPVLVNLRSGVANVKVILDIKKGEDEKALLKNVEDEIRLALDSNTEQIPYNIEIKVENRI